MPARLPPAAAEHHQMTAERRRYYLEAMDIQLWQLRCAPDETEFVRQCTDDAVEHGVLDVSLEPRELVAEPDIVDDTKVETQQDVSKFDWAQLEQKVAECRLCELYKTRIQTVFGVGNRQAALMIVGEAPGGEEDKQGEPFVGPAGQLLNAMLKAIDVEREQVYIANVVKCRPPNNRNPRSEEAEACDPYLRGQIELVQPRLLLALGRVAAQHLLKSQDSLASLRGRLHSFSGIPLRITYHPAYLLRTPLDKRKAWEDLQQVRRFLES